MRVRRPLRSSSASTIGALLGLFVMKCEYAHGLGCVVPAELSALLELRVMWPGGRSDLEQYEVVAGDQGVVAAPAEDAGDLAALPADQLAAVAGVVVDEAAAMERLRSFRQEFWRRAEYPVGYGPRMRAEWRTCVPGRTERVA